MLTDNAFLAADSAPQPRFAGWPSASYAARLRLGPSGLERSLALGKWPARAIICHLADSHNEPPPRAKGISQQEFRQWLHESVGALYTIAATAPVGIRSPLISPSDRECDQV
jgi:hypothetical protein